MAADPRPKTRAEVLRIRRPGRLLNSLFELLHTEIVPGVTTERLVKIAEGFAEAHNAGCPQKGYQGFPSSLCASVNNVAAHGVPSRRVLRDGDILTVDCIFNVDGWNADAAWTYAVGGVDADARRLIRAAWRCTREAVAACRAGSRTGRIAQAAERVARSFGCSVLTDFTGHGIGRNIHEEPAIPFGSMFGEGDPIVPGMVVTIEPVLTLGEPRVMRCEDGVGYETVDGSRTAQFECTVAVFSGGIEILTVPEDLWESEFPPFL